MDKKITKIDFPDTSLTGDRRINLVDRLTEVARDGFGSGITRDDVENHVLKTDRLYLIGPEASPVGFASFSDLDIGGAKVLYLDGMVVLSDEQKNGLFRAVHDIALSGGDFDFLAMRTQNPVVYAATASLVRQLYPAGNGLPDSVKQVASDIARDFLGMEVYDSDNLIGRGVYGTSLYEVIPRHARQEVNDLFDERLKLDYENGDCVLLVGVLKDASAD